MKEFIDLVEQVVEPIRAGSRRKDAMREELLAHLSAVYEEEMNRSGNPQQAAEAARRRFGDVGEMREQLQGVVPVIERWISTLFPEVFMAKWSWVIGWVVVIVLMIVAAPNNDFRFDLVIVGIVGAAGITRLTQESNSITRWFGPRWGWRIVGILFGAGVILPALAMYRDQKRSGAEVVVPLMLGVLMVGIAVVSFVYSIAKRPPRVA
jgi:hypothetical protein